MISGQRNIVLVTIDSLRADRCGFMGYDRDTTPCIDALAADGTVFENAIAPGPSTPESMPVIATGRHLPEHGGRGDVSKFDVRQQLIRDHVCRRETLAERYSRAGYSTAAFTPNPFFSRYFGFDSGFDRFQDFMDRSVYNRIFRRVLENDAISSSVRPVVNWFQREEVFKSWTDYYDEILEWVRTAERPFFVWVMVMDAHNPYLSSDEHRTQSRWKSFHANWRFWRESHETPFDPAVRERLERAYDDAIRQSDALVGRLRADLRADDPVFVVHADHGEAFGEHGVYGHEPYLYEENIHVPLVLGNGNSEVVSDPVSLRRLPELLRGGVERATPGPSSLPFTVARTGMGNKLAMRGRHWKFIRNGDAVYACDLRSDVETLVPLDSLERDQVVNDVGATWEQRRAERQRVTDVAETIASEAPV